MLPHVPGSEHWLAGGKTHFGLSESHPKVARILEILRKKEAGEITVQEHKEFCVLNGQLTSAHAFLYGTKMYPSGEVFSYPEMPTREQIAGAVDWMFDRDEYEDEGRAYSERLAALDRQVRAQGIVLSGGGSSERCSLHRPSDWMIVWPSLDASRMPLRTATSPIALHCLDNVASSAGKVNYLGQDVP